MSLAEKTFELKIEFRGNQTQPPQETKAQVKLWLTGRGEESFVEGVIDGLYMDCDLEEPDRDYYGELGGNSLPISLYKYDKAYLVDLRQRLELEFRDRIVCHDLEMDTKVWLEGWKESFKPIRTQKYYVYPPWDKDPCPAGLIPLEIEPGMAFGTGQHATTQLCLRQLETYLAKPENQRSGSLKHLAVLDVGTGTGILAIAAAKGGVGRVDGTDIDVDSIKASGENAGVNGVTLGLYQGSFPPPSVAPTQGYDLVIANILTPILKKLMRDLSQHVRPGGGLMLSGLLAEDEPEIIKAAAAEQLRHKGGEQLDDWSCLLFEKHP